MQPASDDGGPQADITPQNRLSVIGSEVEALADAAPTLKEAELRVLLELTRRQLTTPGGVRSSSRDLAEACKASRRNVQYALDSLTTVC